HNKRLPDGNLSSMSLPSGYPALGPRGGLGTGSRADLACCLRLPSRWLSYQLRDRIPPGPPLRITPPAYRAMPVGKAGIIKDRAPGNPDPVSRDPLRAIRTPSARVTARSPVRRHTSAVPLARVTGCWMGTNCPQGLARTAAIPHQDNT